MQLVSGVGALLVADDDCSERSIANMFTVHRDNERPPDPPDAPQQTAQSPQAEPFVRKVEKIALHLHHKELRIPHVLLAVALSGDAAQHLSVHGLEADVIRRCCWRALEAIGPERDMPTDVIPSTEINDLFGHAATFSNGQELEVSHILRAMNDVKLVGRYGSLIRNPEPRPEEMDVKVSAIKTRLDLELPEIDSRLERMEAQQEVLVKQMLVLEGNVGSARRQLA